MALKCIVKLSSVTNLSDARYAAGMGVDMLGFDLNPGSSRRLSPEEFAAITGWVSGVKLVGEFDKVPENLSEISQDYNLDMVQAPLSKVLEIQELTLPLMVKLSQPQANRIADQLMALKDYVDYFLLEFPNGEIPKQVWPELEDWAKGYPIILAGANTPEQCERWLNQGIRGFSLAGGDEIKPGYKDFEELAKILEFLEIE